MAELEERIRQTWAASRRNHSAILSRFAAEAQRVGVVVQEVTDLQAAGRAVAAIAKSGGVSQCQTADRDLSTRLSLESALGDVGIRLTIGPAPEALQTAGMGVTGAVLGVAETGSLVIHLDEVDPRLLSMLPEIHVALLHRDALVDSLEEGLLLTRYLVLQAQARGQPSYVSWVTGPSRTADIERVLTIGVHGPKELYLILLPPREEAQGVSA